MEVIRELMKRPRPIDSVAITCFAGSILYTILRGSTHTIVVGIALTLIVLGCLPKHVAIAFLVGASAILLVQQSSGSSGSLRAFEGFTDVSGELETSEKTGDETVDEVEEVEEVEDKEGFSTLSKPLLPDHMDRKEPLVLGKEYKLPNENDDKGFHLDAGTTFLNAYKSLKPDQIAAMTRDTQELLATQKSLVAMLDNFGPLMKDMGKITGFFGGGDKN